MAKVGLKDADRTVAAPSTDEQVQCDVIRLIGCVGRHIPYSAPNPPVSKRGLGPAYATRLIQLNQDTLSIESHPAQGTSFKTRGSILRTGIDSEAGRVEDRVLVCPVGVRVAAVPRLKSQETRWPGSKDVAGMRRPDEFGDNQVHSVIRREALGRPPHPSRGNATVSRGSSCGSATSSTGSWSSCCGSRSCRPSSRASGSIAGWRRRRNRR